MVFFICNNCGTTIKKNQVATHKFKCRNGTVSCMDCGKDFCDTEYEAHIKCVSEEEKYSGKNFVPKANSNKGQKRQENWLDCLNQLLKTGNLKNNIRNIIEQLVTKPNVPQKKAKFENFIRSMNIKSPVAIAEVWDVISKALEEWKTSKIADSKPLGADASAAKKKNIESDELKSDMIDETKLEVETAKEVSKKKKKQKKSNSNEQLAKSEHLENIESNNDEATLEIKNESKKRRRQKSNPDEQLIKSENLENIESNNDEATSGIKNKSKKIKKQKKINSGEIKSEILENIQDDNEANSEVKAAKKKSKKRKTQKNVNSEEPLKKSENLENIEIKDNKANGDVNGTKKNLHTKEKLSAKKIKASKLRRFLMKMLFKTKDKQFVYESLLEKVLSMCTKSLNEIPNRDTVDEMLQNVITNSPRLLLKNNVVKLQRVL